MGKPLTYIGILFSRAAQKSVLLTDRLTIMIVPFTTLVMWAFGAKMTDSLQETMLIGVAITVMAVVVLRLAAASYFVWKDDQTAKAALQAKLDEPERDAEIAMKDFTIETRKELSSRLARLVAMATMGGAVNRIPNIAEKLIEQSLEIDSRINQLSYDVPLRIAAIRLKEYCLSVMKGDNSDPERLWAQRKLTFRLLHKEDHISDLMSLAELQILIEDSEAKGCEANAEPSEDDVMGQLKSLIRKLGDEYYSQETREILREAARDRKSS